MDILIDVSEGGVLRMNYQTHLESSRKLEEAFQSEVPNAQNAEVKSFYQKMASEQRTITNQLQSKVNTSASANGSEVAHQEQQAQQQAQQQAKQAQQGKNDSDQTNA
jgi:hypothetical protein